MPHDPNQDSSDLHDLFAPSDMPAPISAGLIDLKWDEVSELEPNDATPATEDSTSDSLSVGGPSRPLFGRLPLARVIPQDIHSALDYLDAAAVMAGAALTHCPRAKAASLLIGGAGMAASSLTDYRLSLRKVIPIEVHEGIDYAFGVSAIAAPFVLGYRKTAPVVAALHVALGVGTIIASLFTDYRAY